MTKKLNKFWTKAGCDLPLRNQMESVTQFVSEGISNMLRNCCNTAE